MHTVTVKFLVNSFKVAIGLSHSPIFSANVSDECSLVLHPRDGDTDGCRRAQATTIGSYREIAIAIESEAGDSLT